MKNSPDNSDSNPRSKPSLMKTRGGKPWFERSGGFGSGIGGIRVSKTTSAVSLTTLGHIVAFEMADGKAFSKPERMTAAMAARVIMTAAGILFRCLGSSGVIVFCCLFVWRHLAVCCPTACQPATVTIRFPACPAGLSRFNPHLLRGAGAPPVGSVPMSFGQGGSIRPPAVSSPGLRPFSCPSTSLLRLAP